MLYEKLLIKLNMRTQVQREILKERKLMKGVKERNESSDVIGDNMIELDDRYKLY